MHEHAKGIFSDYSLSEIGQHAKIHFLGLDFNWDTIIMTWISMAILILLIFVVTRSIKKTVEAPKGWHNFLEMIFVALSKQVDDTAGEKGKIIAPLIVTLFLFIFTANQLGMLPLFTSPTNDLNTTLGLALMVVFLVHWFGVKEKGLAYIKHFFDPIAPFVLIHIVEEVAKPITLSFRLFGNILAGEILIIILLALLPGWFPIPGVLWLGFSIFVGLVQAFVFSVLSLSYLSIAFKDEH